jgi:hypothetical protein
MFTWNTLTLFNSGVQSTKLIPMRYSIMVQLVTGITVVLVSTAALFGWLQNRTAPMQRDFENEATWFGSQS